MKALAFHEHGGLDQLRYQDVPDPAIGPADVLVRVRACALNHLDLFVREGLPGFRLPLPFWTGCDIAGEVAQVGAAVREVTVGDRVAVNPNLHCGRCEFCQKGEADGLLLRRDPVREVGEPVRGQGEALRAQHVEERGIGFLAGRAIRLVALS